MKKSGKRLVILVIFVIGFYIVNFNLNSNCKTRHFFLDELKNSWTHIMCENDVAYTSGWAKNGDSISFDFSTSPASTMQGWAMDKSQFNNFLASSNPTGTLIAESMSGAGNFFPQYESEWYIVFIKLYSGCTTFTYGFDYSPCIIITRPTSSIRTFTESNLEVAWESENIAGGITIDLYKGSTYIATLDDLTPNDGIEYCQIPEDCTDGSDYKVKLTAPSSNEADYSDAFTIIRRKVVVSRPKITHTFIPHTSERIEWYSYGTSSKVRIDLFLNNTQILEIASETEDDQQYLWTVWQGNSYSNITSSHYQIRIQDINNPKYVDFSSNFTITNEKYLTVLSPNINSTFKAGSTMQVQWETDTPCDEVYIELLRGNTTVKKITADNTHSYKMKIPYKLGGSDDYRILIAAVDSSTSGISEYFTIAPKLRIPGNNILFLYISIFLVSICICILKYKRRYSNYLL